MATEFLIMKAILEFIVLSKKTLLCRPWLNSKSSGVFCDTRIYMLYRVQGREDGLVNNSLV